MILSDLGTDIPSEYRQIFPKLAAVGVLPKDFAEHLVRMAKFRNVLVHLYTEVNHDLLYHYIHHNLNDFVQYIAEYLNDRRIESFIDK
jgi:uncharacterized protein YutE (UPF0331/DUF86 family)